MSNSTGLNTMWIMVGLKGNGGPTLYKLDKTTDTVTKIGPIFTDSNASQTGETMYFSHTMPNALYYVNSSLNSLNYIDVVTHVEKQVFNVNDYHSGDHIFQCSTSFNDQVSACTLEDSSYNVQGCIVYSQSKGFKEIPLTSLNECNVGAAGAFVLIDDNNSVCAPECDNDTIIVDLSNMNQTRISNKLGGGGHYAMGYGYYTQNMNWDSTYNSVKLWNYKTVPTPVGDVWDQPWSTACNYNPTVCGGGPSHPSWLNAVPASVTPIAQQYVCDSTLRTVAKPFSDKVFCYTLDAATPAAQKKALVVAPIMSGSGNTGCGSTAYDNSPKGNIDPTGHYFIWSANLDSNTNCQVFIVKIPASQFPYSTSTVNPPQVSITNPPNAATVFGTIAAKASVSSVDAISNVTWAVDGQTVDSASTAPYTYDLNTSTLSMGSHTLTAVATDVAGYTGTATNDIVVEQAPSSSPSPSPSPVSGGRSGGGSLSLFPLVALWLLAALGLMRKRS